MNEEVTAVRDAVWKATGTLAKVSYVLKNNHENIHAIAYDPSDPDRIFEITGKQNGGFLIHWIQEWDFNVDDYLLDDLEHGYEITYMPIDEHNSIWCWIELTSEDLNHSDGLQNYLKYCQTHDITPESVNSFGLAPVNIMNLYKETNQGYVIISEYTVNKTSYVIGHNPAAPSPYAVWKTSPNRAKGYDYGHYFSTYDDAFSDFYDRVWNEVDSAVKMKRKNFNKEVRRDDAR